MLLSFVAGYVDSYTYIALFGLFVAQVTSSFVIAGARVVIHDYNVTGKLLVTVVFIIAAALTAALIIWARAAGRATLPAMLWLEAALLAIFCAMILFGPPIKNATDWHGIVAGLIAASAMGAQSVLVRLLMKGIPQTNVMTGNMTQLGIAITELDRCLAQARRQPAQRRRRRGFRERARSACDRVLDRRRLSCRRRRRRRGLCDHRPARRGPRRPHRGRARGLGA